MSAVATEASISENNRVVRRRPKGSSVSRSHRAGRYIAIGLKEKWSATSVWCWVRSEFSSEPRSRTSS